MADNRRYIHAILLLSLGAFGIAGCGGSDGDRGATGADGDTGLSCWDLNENGIADPEEDLNGDGVVDVLDCRVPIGGAATVGGTVVSDGEPLDSLVSLSFGAIEVPVEDDGSFTVDLESGAYDVVATRPGYEDFEEDGVEVVGGEDVDVDIDMIAVAEGEYIGSEDCGACHESTYDSFVQTGHPYKLNRAFGDQPEYPFTSLDGVLERVTDEDGMTDNSLGTPQSYDDVSYVIGGYYWKARFVDTDGAIVTGSEVQYNFATDEMVAYHDDEVDKPYNCGNCHTTGWRHTDETLNPDSQDDMQHMHGTFFDGGVQCESCHGSGAVHARTMEGDDITEDAMPRTMPELQADNAGYGLAVACGECHTRDGERDYDSYMSAYDNARVDAGKDILPMGGRIAAKGGLVRHHEQYDEILGVDPDSLDPTRSNGFMNTHGDCNTCHSPHGSSVNVDNPEYTGVAGVDPTNDGCLGCHADYDPELRSGGMMSLDCIDCHMPKMAKSATSSGPVGTGPVIGDVSSHVFRIGLDSAVYQQFTDDGAFAYPALTTDYACRTCHNGEDVFDVSDDVADSYDFHNNVTQ